VVTRLEARGLGHVYPGGIEALAGIDLALEEGELVCVLGPNGAGKSTLLKALGGLLAPTSGTALLEGRELAQWPSRERAQRIAVVPQQLRAIPDLTADAFVAHGRYAHQARFARPDAADRAAVTSALEAADAAELADRPLSELSGGQRQRVLVARALAQEAPLLLVDEPTAGLDPEHQLAVFDLLAALTCHGRAALVVTHELNLASQFATRLVLMAGGRIAGAGTAEEVLRPEALEPVYGPDLAYGELDSDSAGGRRPFVLPWRRSGPTRGPTEL
jgi:iron complex transport system ATP-binding protein